MVSKLDVMRETLIKFRRGQPISVSEARNIVGRVISEIAEITESNVDNILIHNSGCVESAGLNIAWIMYNPMSEGLHIKLIIHKGNPEITKTQLGTTLHIHVHAEGAHGRTKLAVYVDEDTFNGICPDDVDQRQWLLDTLCQLITDIFQT